MLGTWRRAWRLRQERRALLRRAIPDDLWKRTLVRYPFLRRSTDPGAAELRRLTSLFLDRKEFSAAGGLRLSDALVVAIAAQACLPILRLGLSAYDSFVGIVVYPDQVLVPQASVDEAGVVHPEEVELSGQALAGGPVVLSWRDVRAAGRHGSGAYCVVIHEFAHVLDMAQGEIEALPLLPASIEVGSWRALWLAGHRAFVERVSQGEDTLLDPYGATSLTEFFAVAVEAFFVAPAEMQNEHPDLYGMLVRYFRQDPAAEQPPRTR